MWNVMQGAQSQVIGKHDQPVQCMKWLSDLNCLAEELGQDSPIVIADNPIQP